MKVISKSSNNRLIKGHIYTVAFLRNGNSWRDCLILENEDGTALLPGRFKPKSFTDENGESLKTSTTDYRSNLYEKINAPKEKVENVIIGNPKWSQRQSNVQVGDVIACLWEGNTKYLVKDRKYRISKINDTGKGTGSGQLKVEGLSHWLNPYRFRKLNTSESRDLSLSEIFGSTDFKEDYKVDKEIRKMDDYDESKKTKMLLHYLLLSVADSSRHAISTIEWAAKISNKEGITKFDYQDIIDMKLSDILKKIDPNWNKLNFDPIKIEKKKSKKSKTVNN